jgi:hypothetical protein
MPFHIGLAVLALLPASLSRDEMPGLTQQEQINLCHEREAEARALASSEAPETRESYIRLANKWAHRAAEIERYYYAALKVGHGRANHKG